MTPRDKLIAGGTDLESVDAVLRNGDMSAVGQHYNSLDGNKVLVDAKELAELREDKARLDWILGDRSIGYDLNHLGCRYDVDDIIKKEAAK